MCHRRLCFQLLTIWWTRCTKQEPRKSSHIRSGRFGWRRRASSLSLLPVWHCTYPPTYSSKCISICLIVMDPYDDRSSNPDPWFPSKCWNGGFVILMPRSASCFSVNPSHRPYENKHYTTGIILGMGPWRRHCNVVSHWPSPYPEWPLHHIWNITHSSFEASSQGKGPMVNVLLFVDYNRSTFFLIVPYRGPG